MFQVPPAPRSIEKGSTLKVILDRAAVEALDSNLKKVDPSWDSFSFKKAAMKEIGPLSLMQRGEHLASVLYQFLPQPYEKAIQLLLKTLTPPLQETNEFGLGVFFYLPHTMLVARFGIDPKFNQGRDPFETSMRAQYELTQRFTAEYSIRYFLIHSPERTLQKLESWLEDPSPHVRRLCSEGTRSRLPWGLRLQKFVKDPTPCLPILERLKDDPDLYVRRSVANHLGDIAKDHPTLVFDLVEKWLKGADENRLWLLRHALRHPAKKGVARALKLRVKAGS